MHLKKKQQLNKHHLHLQPILADSWNNSWLYVQNATEEIQPEDGSKNY
jgi:hypothetical protein